MHRTAAAPWSSLSICAVFYLQGWPAQSPVQTFCPSWRSTGKLRRHFWTFPPWWGSPGSAQWSEHCCRDRWSLRCGTTRAHTRLSRSHYTTERPCCPRCLSPFEDWPPLLWALRTQGDTETPFCNAEVKSGRTFIWDSQKIWEEEVGGEII